MKPNAKMAVDNFFSLAFVEDTAEGLSRLIENNEIKKIHICSNEVLCRKDLADKIINYSSNGSYMKYSECVFDEIPYKEPRGRVNDLMNILSVNNLTMKYENVDTIIRKK